MSYRRHSDACRADRASTTPETWRDLEWFRRRATRRKLALLECAIGRQAPFADCGRPLWELMEDLPWFRQLMPPAEWYRLRDLMMPAESSRHLRGLPPSTHVGVAGRSWPNSWVSGCEAIEWLEDHADGGDADGLVVARDTSEASNTPPRPTFSEHPPGLGTISRSPTRRPIGSAIFREFDESWRNVLDYYLASFPGTFCRRASLRPIHPEHRPIALELIDDLFGHPSHDIQFGTG